MAELVFQPVIQTMVAAPDGSGDWLFTFANILNPAAPETTTNPARWVVSGQVQLPQSQVNITHTKVGTRLFLDIDQDHPRRSQAPFPGNGATPND